MKDTIINQLIYNLKDAYDGEPWYGASLMDILNKTNHKTINLSIVDQYSIAKVLKHIISWRMFAINMLENNTEFDIQENSEANWARKFVPNEEEWLDLINEFKESQVRLIELLESLNDEFLKKQIPNRTYNYYYLIEGILQHDIYHFGQIAMIHRFVQDK
ncbi:MAG: DinB family protein [Saprospiraceae bacterium]